MRQALIRETCGRRRRLSHSGLTLVELLLAISITALIGAGVASMLFAFAYGSSVQADDRAVMVAAESAKVRMSEAVQSGHMVLAKGNDYLVLWMSDDNGDAAPQLSELRRIEFSSAARTLSSYRPPVNLALDVTYSLSTTDFNAVTNALKGTAQMPGEVWGEVTSFEAVLNNANVRLASLVNWRITVVSGDSSRLVVGGAALRNS